MDNITIVEKGYTVIYDTADGEIGFIGYDSHSGGYPYFASSVDNRHVYKTAGEATKMLGWAKNMKSYYGADNVHFGTMRAVKMSQVFQEVNEDLNDILFMEAKAKLSDAEFDLIKRQIKEGKA